MNIPLRVLHVFGTLDIGGAESRTMDIYRRLNRQKIQFDFMVHTPKVGCFEPEIQELGGAIFHEIPQYRAYNFISYRKAWDRFFINHPYLIVHIHTINMALPILLSAKKAGIACRICHCRGAGDQWMKRLLVRMNQPLIKRLASNCFAVSKNAGIYGFKNGFQIVYNPIPFEKYRFDKMERERVRQENGWEYCFVIGQIGRFHPVKNHLFFLNVFASLIKSCPQARLLLIGDGDFRPQIEQTIRSLNLDRNVQLLGLRSDVSSLLQGVDLIVLPSISEGLPGVALEAQAAACPVLLSNTIAHEVNILTDIVEYLPIDRGVKPWLSAIHDRISAPCIRADTVNDMKAAGFDADQQTAWYEEFYQQAATLHA